jgi:hypothetical protein
LGRFERGRNCTGGGITLQIAKALSHILTAISVGEFFKLSFPVNNSNFNSIIQIGVYDLNLKEQSYQLTERVFQGDWVRYYDSKTSCEYFTTSAHTGILTITHLDKVNYIISGTFEFEVYSADCQKVIKVTDGRFDLHYAP